MITKKCLLASGFALSLLTQSALATGLYVKSSGGLTSPDAHGFDKALGFSVLAGYQVNNYFAIQGGGVYLGSFDMGYSWDSDRYTDEDTLSFYGAEASLVGYLPVNKAFALYGKLGILAWESDYKTTYSGHYHDYSISTTEDGVDALYGIGAEFFLNPNFSVITEATYYDIDNFSISYYSAGVKFNF